MSIFTCTAGQLGYVKSAEQSNWNASGACQGVYGRGGTPRVGAILFDGLREVDWAGQNISRITLTLTFPRAGYGRIKTIGLNRGAQASFSGAGADMLGDRIGEFVTNGRAYNAATVNIFDESTDPDVFAGLVAWLQQSDSPILVTYMADENPYDFYSANYAMIKAAALTIEHEPAGSGGSLDRTRVNAGETVTLTIDPLDEAGATHSVEWMMGEAAQAFDVGDGLTASFTVPMEWLNQIPDAVSGAAKCLLSTYVGGELRAVRTIPFIVDVPESVVPTFDAVVQPSGTTGGYYQYLGGATLRADNARSYYGASVSAYAISGSEGETSAFSSLTTADFQMAGEHTYVIAVTDTRGRTSQRSVTIDVIPLAEPVIRDFSVRRYSTKIDDAGEVVCYDSLSGGYVWVTVDAEIDPAGGNNVPTAYILYGDRRFSVGWAEGAVCAIENDRTIIRTKIPLNAAHEFTLVLEDRHSEVSAFARVEKSWTQLHLAGSGFGAAFGGFSTATEAAPELRSYWPVYGSDGFLIDGFVEAIFDELTSPFVPDAVLPPKVLRAGRMVQISGAFSASSAVSGSANELLILTLPRAYWPARDVYQICQGGTTRIWLLHVSTTGQVTFSRYHYSSGYDSLSAGTQLLLNAAWIAADNPVETPEDDTELTYITYPAAAMTANSSQSCVASASSVYSASSFPVYYAFDNERKVAWAAKSDDAAPWIQLQMPQALKKISVKVYSWDTTNKYKGDPVSGTLMGSADGVGWTQIGTYSGWSEGTNGLLGEIVCDNSDAYSYVRLNISSYESGAAYVAVGYITITGGIPA